MKTLKYVILSGALVFLNGCGVSGGLAFFNSAAKQDYGKSTITATSAPADGTSKATVTMTLLNSNGTPVTPDSNGFTPAYKVTSGTGYTANPCTPIDAKGMSTCTMTSKVAGKVHVVASNIPIPSVDLEMDVVFTPPAVTSSLSQTELVPGGQPVATGNGYSVSGTVGYSLDQHVVSGTGGASGYKVYGGIQGAWSNQ